MSEQQIQETGLPPAETPIVTIKTIMIPPFGGQWARSYLRESVGSDLQVNLITIKDDSIKGFMPSKIWHDVAHGFVLLYYINPTLPLAVRPFKGNTHLMHFELTPGINIEYDARIRLYIDQVKVIERMHCVSIFGDESYDAIIKEVL